MANSANPEINKKIATSALGTLVIATVFFYLGDRYAETLVTYPGQIFDHLSDAFLSMWQTIKDVLPSLRAWNIELCSYSSITELITTIVFLPFLAPAEYCVPDMTGYFLLCRYRFQKDAAVVGHRCDVINATQHVVLVPSVMNLMYDLCHRPIDQIRYIEKGAVGGKEGHGFRPFTVSGLLPLPVTLPRLRQCQPELRKSLLQTLARFRDLGGIAVPAARPFLNKSLAVPVEEIEHITEIDALLPIWLPET